MANKDYYYYNCFQNGYLGQTGHHVLSHVVLECSREEGTALW